MLVLALLAGCGTSSVDTETPPPPPRDTADPVVTYPEQIPGAPMVGAAEGHVRLPIGTPLGGYTARCECMLGFSRQDERDSAFTEGFVPSTGVQTYPGIKVIWLSNGDDHLVLTKTDSIYSWDGLVESLTNTLEQRTGVELSGRVIHTANHSHGSFGTFSDAVTFYLGSDTFHRENFERMVDQMADVAMEAYEQQEPGRVGVGWQKDWDPEGVIYSDRRGENNDLAVWPDAEPGMGKDPHLGLLRFDDADGNPLAVVVNFGMHGIIGSESNPMVTTDSGGHLEAYLQEAWEEPVVVMFAQGSGGDASPRGLDDGFARMESIGMLATDRIRDAIEATPTSDAPISLETASRHIPISLETAHVSRGGTVDWYYLPYEEDREDDGIVYESDGSLATPLDEFNAEHGALFCGQGFPLAPPLDTNAEEYGKCVEPENLSGIIELFFTLPTGELELPIEDTVTAGTTVTRLGPVPTLLPDGTQVDQDLLLGFFPGEATAMYGEQWRRRVKAELGYDQAMMISYAQDHEGYLLIPEDWLAGGYEPDITVWGPLGGEHIMEGVLLAGEEVLSTSAREDADPDGLYAVPTFRDAPFEVHTPDSTPSAGTRLDVPPAYLWTPFYADGLVPADALVVPAEVPRVQGIVQLAWEGGDAAIDSPRVVLQRQDGTDWVDVTTATGRPVDDAGHSILVGHTPFPLAPHTDAQEHRYWAAWQAVGHTADKASLPLGTYRLHVEGERFVGSETTWPFTTEAYTVDSEPFDLVPADLTVRETKGGLTVALVAPELGYRLIDLAGSSVGDNPPVGEIAYTLRLGDGTETQGVLDETVDGLPFLPIDLLTVDVDEVLVEDEAGNVGVFLPKG